ncbi:MAG TPA: phenylacetate--CoA ligase [Bacillus bacterium]|uniref:Phenylacetate-coenzyme A ligase n=1 Tax=Siminovitchia fordii TaxID=254759 RepID=A0ABQ4K5W6_9BACI|nr:phenylacetate--CoA ligase [Siminovitchia fordii]GIN21129.1 phenylacetate-coenzyme A ligase [Siminovitchia fordii]HBZ09510.1 phenylacetate--CoA ligase [Bacillus sp. (in: firmicutes)]
MIYNLEMETLPTLKMEKLQIVRLQETLDRVYNKVKFYKEKFNEKGIKIEDIKNIADISKLPFTRKQDLRDHYPFGLFAEPIENIVRLHGSSGTSGKPTVVSYTKNDIKVWSELIARAIVAAGGSKGDLFHNAYGYGLFTGGLGLHFGAEELGAAVVPISGGNTERQILAIQDFKPKGLACTPSYALNIGEKMRDMGLDSRENSLKYGIFGAEPWSEEMRATIEDMLGIKAVDIYGLSEIMGPGVSIECHVAQDGLHIADDHFLVEVIDPKTLEPVEDGKDGELVFTTLTKEAFPLVRYRTGDIASITRRKCQCGRTTTRMSRVKGRTDDMIIIRGVNVFPSEIERVLLKIEGLSPHYQIRLFKDGPLDCAELHVEMSDELYLGINEDLEHEKVQMLERKIKHEIKSACLVSVKTVMGMPKSIPRSEGKAVRIVDQRNSSPVMLS